MNIKDDKLVARLSLLNDRFIGKLPSPQASGSNIKENTSGNDENSAHDIQVEAWKKINSGANEEVSPVHLVSSFSSPNLATLNTNNSINNNNNNNNNNNTNNTTGTTGKLTPVHSNNNLVDLNGQPTSINNNNTTASGQKRSSSSISANVNSEDSSKYARNHEHMNISANSVKNKDNLDMLAPDHLPISTPISITAPVTAPVPVPPPMQIIDSGYSLSQSSKLGGNYSNIGGM